MPLRLRGLHAAGADSRLGPRGLGPTVHFGPSSRACWTHFLQLRGERVMVTLGKRGVLSHTQSRVIWAEESGLSPRQRCKGVSDLTPRDVTFSQQPEGRRDTRFLRSCPLQGQHPLPMYDTALTTVLGLGPGPHPRTVPRFCLPARLSTGVAGPPGHNTGHRAWVCLLLAPQGLHSF